MKKLLLLFTIIISSVIMLSAQIDPADSGLTGLYTFSEEGAKFANKSTSGDGVGTIMCEGVLKFDPDSDDTGADDMPSVEGEDWSWADGIISMNAHNWLKIWHGIAANGGGDYVNDFTVVIDVRVSDANGVYSLVEVNPTPKSAGYSSEMEIENLKLGSVDKPWSSDGIPHSTQILETDTWYRITYVAKLSEYIRMFVNGELYNEATGDNLDSRPAPYSADSHADRAAMKIGGNNETIADNNPARDGNKEVDMVAIYNRTLSDTEVAALGGPGSILSTKGVSQNRNNLGIYPNPASDRVNIMSDMAGKLEIINWYGQVVNRMNLDTQRTSMDVSNIAKGFYTVRLTDEKGNITSRKLVIE